MTTGLAGGTSLAQHTNAHRDRFEKADWDSEMSQCIDARGRRLYRITRSGSNGMFMVTILQMLKTRPIQERSSSFFAWQCSIVTSLIPGTVYHNLAGDGQCVGALGAFGAIKYLFQTG